MASDVYCVFLLGEKLKGGRNESEDGRGGEVEDEKKKKKKKSSEKQAMKGKR